MVFAKNVFQNLKNNDPMDFKNCVQKLQKHAPKKYSTKICKKVQEACAEMRLKNIFKNH